MEIWWGGMDGKGRNLAMVGVGGDVEEDGGFRDF